MIVLDDEDFANLPISSSRAVEVLSFVPAEQVDAVQFVKAYFCDPTGDVKPYVLLRDSLEQADKVAIVKVALRQRERLAMLRTRDGVLVLQTLLWPDEVREARFDFLDQDVTVRPQELAMAESYISALSADFDPGEYADHYREALESVIADKAAGREVKAPAEEAPASGQVVDLMEALRRSVAEAKTRRGEGTQGGTSEADAPAEEKGTAGKSATKKTTAKKTAKSAATAKKASKSTKAAKKTTEKKAAARRSA
jgi:DNA end-binding protein Ku